MKCILITNNWNDKVSAIKNDRANAKESLINAYLKLYINSNADKECSYIDKEYGIITTKDNKKIEFYII